jgi:hypothetical protein
MRRWLRDHGMFDGVGGQTVFLVLSTGIILVSLLIGFGRIAAPEPLRISLAFLALFVLPGAAVSGLVFRPSLEPLETICSVFAMGLSFSSGVVCVGFIPGVSYAAISVVGAALTVALLFIEHARRTVRSGNDPDSRRTAAGTNRANARFPRSVLVCIVLYALCFFVFYGSGELGSWTDSPDHVSFVRRSVESNVLFPHDSFYREGDGSSFDMRKGLWHPVLSLWTYQSHATADRVWRTIPSFTVFFVLSSFILFALEVCGSRLCAAVSLVFFFLFYGGEGIEWLTKLGFSRNIAQTFLWIDLAFLLRYYRSNERRYLLATFVMACVGAAYHVAFALLLGTSLLGLFVYVTFLREGREWRFAFWRSVPVQLAALAIPLAARAHAAAASYSAIHTHQQGMLVFSPHLAIVDPAKLVTTVGIVFFFALLMAPFFFFVTRAGNRRSLVFVLFLVPVCIVLDPITASFMERRIGYLHYRILDAAPLMLLLALVVTGLAGVLVFGKPQGRTESLKTDRRITGRSIVGRIAAAGALALFLYYPVRAAMHQFDSAAHAIASHETEMPARFAPLVTALNERIPDHSVIVSDPLTSYVISACTDHFVVVTLDQHDSPADTSSLNRIREVRNLLSPAVPLAASGAWLEQVHAEYVVLDTHIAEHSDFFAAALPGSARLTYEKFIACRELLSNVLDLDGFRVFEVRREFLGRALDSACTVPRAAALSCEGEPGEGTSREAAGGRTAAASERTEESGSETSGATEDGRLVVDSERDVGCGVVLARLAVDRYALHPGDTLRGHVCWKAPQPLLFGLPLEAVVRIDTEYPKGAWYRPWYSKQYRRVVERRNSRFYRFTWSERLMSGFTYPDQWEPGRIVRQDFSLPLSAWMAPGAYELRIKVVRRSYVTNRGLSDYLSNNDSLEGVVVAEVIIAGSPGR